MKKILITLIIALFCGNMYAKNKTCYIRMNTSDCINSYGGFAAVSRIDTTTTEVFYVAIPSDKTFVKKLFEEVLYLKYPESQMIFSDSMYQSLSKNPKSTVHLFSNKNKDFKFEYELGSLSQVVNYINYTQNTYDNVSTIKTDLPQLSNNINLFCYKEDKIIYDYLFNGVSIINAKKPNKTIKGKDLINPAIYEAFFGETISAEMLQEQAEKMKKIRPMVFIDNLSFNKDTLLLLVSFCRKDEIEKSIKTTFGLVKIIDNTVVYAMPIKRNNDPKNDVFMDQISPFYVDETGGLNVCTMNIDLDSKNNTFMANYKQEGGSYVFNKKLSYQLPQEYEKFKMPKTADYGLSQNLIYFKALNTIFDTKKNEYFKVNTPKKIKYTGKGADFLTNYYVCDVEKTGGSIFMSLNMDTDEYYMIEVDYATKKTLYSKKLNVTNKDLKIAPIFNTNGRLIYLNQNNELVEIY